MSISIAVILASGFIQYSWDHLWWPSIINLPPPPVTILLPAILTFPPFKQLSAEEASVKGNFNDLSTSISFWVGFKSVTLGDILLGSLIGCLLAIALIACLNLGSLILSPNSLTNAG